MVFGPHTDATTGKADYIFIVAGNYSYDRPEWLWKGRNALQKIPFSTSGIFEHSGCLLLTISSLGKRYFRRSLGSVKIVRAGLRACDVERRDAGGFDGDDSVLVLQNSFNH